MADRHRRGALRRLALAAAAALLVVLPAAAATKQYSSGRLALPLASRRTTEHTLTVRDAGPVSHVAVWVRLADSRVGDLTLSLRAPDGATVLLAQRRGGEAKNLGTGTGCGGRLAIFDDAEGAAFADVPAPFVESPLKPEERLGSLDGRPAQGTWTLRISSDGTGNTGTLQCWQLDLSRDILESRAASYGRVSARLSYREQDFGYRGFRLRIERAGRTAFDAAPGRPVARGWRPVELRVLDLDGDREPEVLADFYSGGAHCCTYSTIYRFVRGRYVRLAHSWGNPGYRLTGLDRDRRPELVTEDDRFNYAFTAYAFSRAPIRILSYDHGRLRDVTRGFAGAIARDATRVLREYRTPQAKTDARGVLAAYVADEYLLGHPERGWSVVDGALRRGHLNPDFATGYPAGKAYVRKLRAFLRSAGYAR